MQKEILLKWKQGFHFTSHSDNGTVTNLDLAKATGGEDKGASPVEAMLTALGGCSAMSAINILGKMQVSIQSMEVRTGGQIEPIAGTDRITFTSFHIVYTIAAKPELANKINHAISLSHEKYCNVATMYQKIAPVSYEVHLL